MAILLFRKLAHKNRDLAAAAALVSSDSEADGDESDLDYQSSGGSEEEEGDDSLDEDWIPPLPPNNTNSARAKKVSAPLPPLGAEACCRRAGDPYRYYPEKPALCAHQICILCNSMDKADSEHYMVRGCPALHLLREDTRNVVAALIMGLTAPTSPPQRDFLHQLLDGLTTVLQAPPSSLVFSGDLDSTGKLPAAGLWVSPALTKRVISVDSSASTTAAPSGADDEAGGCLPGGQAAEEDEALSELQPPGHGTGAEHVDNGDDGLTAPTLVDVVRNGLPPGHTGLRLASPPSAAACYLRPLLMTLRLPTPLSAYSAMHCTTPSRKRPSLHMLPLKLASVPGWRELMSTHQVTALLWRQTRTKPA